VATNRALRTALLAKLGVTPQRLSQKVAQIKRLYGPMTTEEGTYLLAHQEGIDLTKFLPQAAVDRVRGFLPTASVLPKAGGTRAARASTSTKALRIAPTLELVDALLSTSVAGDAQRMASVYPKLYIFENSIRTVVVRVLKSKYGTDWWVKRVPTGIQKTVTARKSAESKTPWHGKRGTHEIYYSNFGDLRDIIVKNWSDFQPIFLKQPWITQRLEELEPPRNIIAHNNPLSRHEEDRIDLYFNDWIALLNDRKGFVP
jgi:hypothetical protein